MAAANRWQAKTAAEHVLKSLRGCFSLNKADAQQIVNRF
jgi:hypothetical protein